MNENSGTPLLSVNDRLTFPEHPLRYTSDNTVFYSIRTGLKSRSFAFLIRKRLVLNGEERGG